MTYKIENFFAEGLPNASGAFNGFPEYNFVGGHNSEKNIPVKELVISAQNMHDRMFLPYGNGLPILLDQCGSGWNPIESTKYFLDSKVVLVTRDPRDQFAEIKHYKNGGSVYGFIDWYKEMQKRLKLINDPKVLSIKFEEFVKNNEKIKELICNHFSLTLSTLSNYRPDLSEKNIGKFKNLIANDEIEIIESNLSEFISD